MDNFRRNKYERVTINLGLIMIKYTLEKMIFELTKF